MPAYAIKEILVVKDDAAYGEYVEKVFSIVEKYHGRYLIRDGMILTGSFKIG
jgi:uncharacterized protein (DUF1330 family)